MDDVHGISILHDPGMRSSSDLIAVHGIKGHPFKTWTHPNGARWLEDYLPKDLADTRIMTFGYNSQVFTSSRGCITDYAEQLLQHLISVRRSTDSTDRPLVFLCHSLGGLVVKKALVLAQATHDASTIRKATIAVVFMGTPHRGSPLATYADVAVTCAKVVGFKANVASLHQLKIDSEELEELGSQFGSLLQSERIKALSFFELKPTKIAGITEAVVVPKSSAKLGLGHPLETIIPVDSDHRQIAQFPSRDCKQYGIIKSNLVFILSTCSGIPEEPAAEESGWHDVLSWLGALRGPPGFTPQKERANETCEWIHAKASYRSWSQNQDSALLWIFGRPGVGKTILSNYISETLKSNVNNMAIMIHCHSYRSSKDPVHALIRDILFQALQIPILSAKVKQRLLELKSQANDMSNVAFDTLLGAVDHVLSGNPNLFLIIDGIDEINGQTLELEYLLQQLTTLARSSKLYKVLIVSRNTPFLEKLLPVWKRMAISASDSLCDISIFLNQRLGSIEHLGSRRDEVIERLVDGSKGLFLWADLAVSELDHLRTWNEVSALLENGNCGLDDTYATIIKQLDTSSEGICRMRARALPLVAIACRPFHLEEVTELLAIEVSKPSIDPGNKLLGGWRTLSRACGPFLQMNERGTIELIHVSAKDFLMTHPWAKSLAQENLIGGSPDVEMACLCISYLSFAIFERLPGEEVEVMDVESLAQECSFLEYASNFWSDHFLRSETVTTFQVTLLEQFLNSPCSLTWTTTFYPYFSQKYGESRGTIFRSQQSIMAKLKQKLRVSGSVDPALSKRCIEKCNRFLMESVQDSLRMEQFNSGLLAKSTLEKKLRLAECYCALRESHAAEQTASEALESAQEVLRGMEDLALQLRHVKLTAQMQIQQISSSAGSTGSDLVAEFSLLVNDHTRIFGPDHLKTLCCRRDLALMHFINQDVPTAQSLLEPVYQRMLETLGRTSRETQSVANNLASCANMQAQYHYAEKILQTIPELSKAAADPLEIELSSVHVLTLHALSILAAVLGARGEDHRSEILHQRVIDGLTILEGPNARKIYESAINKGQALRDQHKYLEARKHYQEWYKRSTRCFGPDSKYPCEIRKRLTDLDLQEKKWMEMAPNVRGSVVRSLHAGKEEGIMIFVAIAAIVPIVLYLWTHL